MSLFGFGTKKNKKENSVESQEQKTTEELLEEEKEVMIPRIDVDFINIETDRAELLEKISDSGHSRFPVYKDSIDNVIGVLYVKDLIRCFSKEEPFELEKIIRKAYFVP